MHPGQPGRGIDGGQARRRMTAEARTARTARTDGKSRDSDTALTDALLDQFAGYYVLVVLAVELLEEARRQRRLASD